MYWQSWAKIIGEIGRFRGSSISKNSMGQCLAHVWAFFKDRLCLGSNHQLVLQCLVFRAWRFSHPKNTLQGTNISPKHGVLKMSFLFPRWDMLIPWRVFFWSFFWVNQNPFLKKSHEFVKGTQKIESKQLSEVPLELPGGGFNHFLFSHPTWGRFPF